jgi:cobalt-zinc-cadmium efflux system outer membrane protein
MVAALAPALATSGALAQTPPKPAPATAQVSSLLRDDRAVTEWLEQRHHDVRAAEARVAQSRADLGAARILLPNPQLDVTLGGLQVGAANTYGGMKPISSFGDTYNIGVGLTQTIELGKRGPRIDAAELRLAGSGKAYLDTLGDRVADARTALARVAYLKSKMALLEDTLAGSKRVADLQKARLDRGAVSGNDYDRLLLDNISLEADIARARGDLEGALAACAAVMHAPCDAGSAQIGDVDAAAPVPANVTAMAGELEKRPDIQATRLEGSAAEKDAVLAERRAIPDPSVRVGLTHDSYLAGGGQPNAFQVTLTVPLPLFDHGQHDAAKARAHALEQRRLADAKITGAQGDLASLLAKKAFLEGALKTFDTVAVPKSTGILDTTQKAFDQGQVSMTDLLLARRTHLALMLGQMDLHFEFFSVRNDLRHTLGLDTATVEPRREPADESAAAARRPPRRVGSRSP